MTTHRLPGSSPSAARRLLAAVAAAVAIWGGLGIHLGPHDHAGENLTATDAVAACAKHFRSPHVEPTRTVHFRECPACLLGHSNLGAARSLGPALSAAAPEVLPTTPPLAAARLSTHAPGPRGPPARSV